jgi:hypothetical protein
MKSSKGFGGPEVWPSIIWFLNELPKLAMGKWFWNDFKRFKHCKRDTLIDCMICMAINKFKRDFGSVCHSKTIVPAFAGMEVVRCYNPRGCPRHKFQFWMRGIFPQRHQTWTLIVLRVGPSWPGFWSEWASLEFQYYSTTRSTYNKAYQN